LLVCANLWMFFSENNAYTRDLTSIHSFLLDDLESVIPDNGVVNWADYTKKTDYLTRVSRLRPPIWKMNRHLEYLNLLDDLERMEGEIRPSANNQGMVQAGLGMLKGVDTAALMQTMQAAEQQRTALRAQLLPKYQDKIAKLKSLYQQLD